MSMSCGVEIGSTLVPELPCMRIVSINDSGWLMSMPAIECAAPCCTVSAADALAVANGKNSNDTHVQQSAGSQTRPGISLARIGEQKRSAAIKNENLTEEIAIPLARTAPY